MARKKRRVQQLLMPGFKLEPKEAAPAPTTIFLSFNGESVRMIVRDGQPWWVAADVCKVLGLDNPTKALLRLDADEKDTLNLIQGNHGSRTVNVVNEFGLYSLVLSSRKPEAKAFKRWVCHEVLPQIRKTGSYSVTPRIARTMKRLGCDERTAKARVEQVDENVKSCGVLAGKFDATVVDYAAWHNAAHKGMTGRTAAQLREILGCTDTPLNHMGHVPLSINSLAKSITMVRAENGGMTKQEAFDLLESNTREFTKHSLDLLGSDYGVYAVEDERRGKIIDVSTPSAAISAA